MTSLPYKTVGQSAKGDTLSLHTDHVTVKIPENLNLTLIWASENAEKIKSLQIIYSSVNLAGL